VTLKAYIATAAAGGELKHLGPVWATEPNEAREAGARLAEHRGVRADAIQIEQVNRRNRGQRCTGQN